MLFNQWAQSLICVIAPLVRWRHRRLDHISCRRVRSIPIQYSQTFLSSRFQCSWARDHCSSLWIVVQNGLRHPIFGSVSASSIQIVPDVYVDWDLLIAQSLYWLLLLCSKWLARLWKVLETLFRLVHLCPDGILELLHSSLIFIQNGIGVLWAKMCVAGIVITHSLLAFLGFASSYFLLRLCSRSGFYPFLR